MDSAIEIPSIKELTLVMPEIWLIIGMCVVIMVPLIKRKSMGLPAIAAAGALLAAIYATCASFTALETSTTVLGGMLAIDTFSQMFKILLLVFTLLILAQWWIATRQETLDVGTPDLWCLMLGACFGMCLMASATNLLMIFVAIESASIPSYVLAGFRRRHRIGTEGSLKYVLFGAASTAINIYGMSLIYGMAGSLDLDAVTASIAAHGVSPLMAVGLLGMFCGIAFKLSAVPLHFWCPDVFQGAPMEVVTFLSVASKGAAVVLLVRVLQTISLASGANTEAFFTGLGIAIAILGGVTATWGNLVALRQSNIKRLLAYSSIAHSGYMIMGASLLATAQPGDNIYMVSGAILFYLLVYMFMNLGAFTIAAVVAEHDKSEDIADYAGLGRRSPLAAVLFCLFLLSLFGMPTLGGFMGKFFLVTAMAKLGGAAGFILIAVLLANTVFSLYYYMRPCYYMYFKSDPHDQPAFGLRFATAALLVVCAAMLLFTGILPSVAGDFLSKNVMYRPLVQAKTCPLPFEMPQCQREMPVTGVKFAAGENCLKDIGHGPCDQQAGQGPCEQSGEHKPCDRKASIGDCQNRGGVDGQGKCQQTAVPCPDCKKL